MLNYTLSRATQITLKPQQLHTKLSVVHLFAFFYEEEGVISTLGSPVVPEVCKTYMASVALTGTQSCPWADAMSSSQEKSRSGMRLAESN